MRAVRVSSKYQVRIPREARESLNLVAGQRMKVLRTGYGIALIPIRPVRKARRRGKGIART